VDSASFPSAGSSRHPHRGSSLDKLANINIFFDVTLADALFACKSAWYRDNTILYCDADWRIKSAGNLTIVPARSRARINSLNPERLSIGRARHSSGVLISSTKKQYCRVGFPWVMLKRDRDSRCYNAIDRCATHARASVYVRVCGALNIKNILNRSIKDITQACVYSCYLFTSCTMRGTMFPWWFVATLCRDWSKKCCYNGDCTGYVVMIQWIDLTRAAKRDI